MPSTYSRVVSLVLPSSTSTTPSAPTLSMASAMRLPISLSWLAETVATLSSSERPSHLAAMASMVSPTTRAASVMPRCTATPLAPAVMWRSPST